MSGSKSTHHDHRRKLRRKLERQGVPAEEIERRVAELMARQQEARLTGQPLANPQPPPRRAKGRLFTAPSDPAEEAARYAAQRARIEAETYRRFALDDRGYRPGKGDSLRTGPARATGMTAKVATRKNTITRWQYDEIQAGKSGR